jgi:hypothetical protein
MRWVNARRVQLSFTPRQEPEITRYYLFQTWKNTVEKVGNLDEK